MSEGHVTAADAALPHWPESDLRYAQIQATLALAAEQRTANLIAWTAYLTSGVGGELSPAGQDAVTDMRIEIGEQLHRR